MAQEIEASLADSAAALAGSGFLSLLDNKVAAEILARGERQRVVAGQTLFRQGEFGDSAFIVLEGALDVFASVGAAHVQLARLSPHQLVGEIAVFARLPRTATVVAATDGMLLRLHRDEVFAVVERHPQAAVAIIADLGKRLATVNTPLAFLSTATQLLRTESIDAEALVAMAASVQELGPFARTFAEMVKEIKVKQERQQDMAMATRIQQSLLPRPLDSADKSFAIHAFLRPTREVGGDLYDYFMIDDRHLAFAVADVSGKGVSAALFMAMLRSLVRALAMPEVGPDRLIERTNAALVEGNDACMFVTVFLGVLDIATGRLTFVNAGHNQGYRLSANGERSQLVANGIALGIKPNLRCQTQSIDLAPGDLIVLYTDGVTESFSAEEEQFGDRRLEDLLKGLHRHAAEAVVEKIVAAVDAFAAGRDQFDDITCLALAWNPRQA